MKPTTILSSLALAGFAQAGTHEPMGTAINGALDLPAHPTVTAVAAARQPFVTISVINMQAVAVSTAHTSARGGPTPSPGPLAPGTIAPSQTVEFAIPTGFAGNMAIANKYDRSGINTTCNSLIEFSFVVPESGPTYAVADVDVSYVNGFTVPITCGCKGKVVSGCNTNLFNTGTPCGKKYGSCCSNPKRDIKEAKYPAPFFKTCAAKAYTFPKDDGANSFGECQGVPIVCCIGTKCPANAGA